MLPFSVYSISTRIKISHKNQVTAQLSTSPEVIFNRNDPHNDNTGQNVSIETACTQMLWVNNVVNMYIIILLTEMKSKTSNIYRYLHLLQHIYIIIQPLTLQCNAVTENVQLKASWQPNCLQSLTLILLLEVKYKQHKTKSCKI